MRFALDVKAPESRERRTVVIAIGTLPAIGLGYLSHSLLLYAALLTILLMLAVVSPVSVVVAVPAVAGLMYQPLHAGGAEFSPAETLIVAICGGVVLRAAIAAWQSGPTEFARRARDVLRGQLDGLGLVALGLLVAGTLSLFTLAMPAYRHESLRYYRWEILEPLAYFVVARHYLRPAGMRALAAAFFVAGGLFVALSGLFDIATGSGISVEGVRRISGVYPHPNALALFIERPAVFATVLGLAYRRAAVIWLAPAAVMGVVLLFTYSRGAMLAVAASVILTLLLSGRRRLGIGLALAFLIGGVAIAATASARILNLFSGGSGSLRLDLWRSALAMIRDHPVFGIGLDQFLYVYTPRYVRPAAWSERFTSHPHDIILDLWLSLGILGLVVAVAFIVVLARLTVRALRRRCGLALASVAVILAGLLHGFVDNGYFLPDLALIFWFMSAMLAAGRMSGRDIQA